ncbi:fenitrothion hydrolase [Conexibacter sp. W3-3-2]|uniref:fenitrothion hydrolase n=1 Tax=Conexibacter sp. W3-3-2 TaxID=2675227 RepID=UPI00132B81BA|nr:fenitrothion hydrolase [Conexibacter sp. W3-3-2]MTD47488.1 fenitrothion hydrolase [Conexibacter sp. W3-3-2]
MLVRSRLRVPALLAVVLLLLLPASSAAHGLVIRADLPIPEWLFGFGAAVVVIVTFVLLAVAWRTPRLEEPPTRWLAEPVARAITSRGVEVVAGTLGVLALALVVWAGATGTETPAANLAPTFVYVGVWLGFVPLSIVFGDVFRLFNPWRAIGRGFGALTARLEMPEPLTYPDRLGNWPAAAGLLAFAWLELVASNGDLPTNVATATCIYTALQLVGMSLFGVRQWCDRAEAFGVYFNLLSRMSPWVRDGRRIGIRRPLAGLASLPVGSGTVALLAVIIGSTSFDGFSGGATWQDWTRWLLDLFGGLGLSARYELELAYGVGLVGAVLVVAGFFLLGSALTRRAAGDARSAAEIARLFVHGLVPIGAAYIAAHYVSLLLLQGQALAFLASDPRGDGSNILGTANWGIDYGWISPEAVWYVQVGSVVIGHAAALAVAHDRALVLYREVRRATRSQIGMLVVMVGFTILALWLLSEAAKG